MTNCDWRKKFVNLKTRFVDVGKSRKKHTHAHPLSLSHTRTNSCATSKRARDVHVCVCVCEREREREREREVMNIFGVSSAFSLTLRDLPKRKCLEMKM